MKLKMKGKEQTYIITVYVEGANEEGKWGQEGMLHIRARSAPEAQKKVTRKVCKKFPQANNFHIKNITIGANT